MVRSVTVPADALTWLRRLDAEALSANGVPDGTDVAAVSYALSLMARLTPAWIERYVLIWDRLSVRFAGMPALIRQHPPCPQVVDVDFPTVALTRAEWVRESLLLTLSPERDDPRLLTTFRIVGAEPRIWCMSGIDGATTDVTAHSVIVRVPLVAGVLEFTPGSY